MFKYINIFVLMFALFFVFTQNNIISMEKFSKNSNNEDYLDNFIINYKNTINPESGEKEIEVFKEAYGLYLENYLKPISTEEKQKFFDKANKILAITNKKNQELKEGKEIKEISYLDLIELEKATEKNKETAEKKEDKVKEDNAKDKEQEAEQTSVRPMLKNLAPYKKLNATEVMDLVMNFVLNDIDAHTSWLNPKTARKFVDQLQGKHKGIGILFSSNKDENFLEIKKVFKDSGADKGGLLPGDKIYFVDGKRINIGAKFENVESIVSSIRGESGTKVKLLVKRKDKITNAEKDITLSIMRGDYYIPSVEYKIIDNKYAYIQIFNFNHDTSDLYLKALRSMNVNSLKGLILDLRDNPGGLLQQAVIIGDSLLSGEEVVSVKGRDESRDQVYRSLPRSIVSKDIPVVVLLSGQSASASELLSAGFALNNRAIIMGDYSFGKWSVQTPFTLSDKSMFNITTQLFYAPFGNTFQGSGIAPDIAILPNTYFKGKSSDLTEEQISLEHKKEFRESSYPNWLKVDNVNAINRKPKIITNEFNCPKHEDKDFVLGCALIYLKYNNVNTFVNMINKIEDKRLKINVKNPKDFTKKMDEVIKEVVR